MRTNVKKNETMKNKSTSNENIEKHVSKVNEKQNNGNVTKEASKKSRVSSVKVEKRPITDFDEYLFHEGKHTECYTFLGAHFVTEGRKKGVRFTTWAPNASEIFVVGEFNNWEIRREYKMLKFNDTGLWTVFIPSLEDELSYKYAITNKNTNVTIWKADPYAFKSEIRPKNASVLIKDSKYKWTDRKWINKRAKVDIYTLPMNTYELHLGSWKTKNGEFMTYEEIADILPSYVKEMGYTHVELMPLNEHPLDASWGYQATGYFSPSSRHNASYGLKELINRLHKEDIGVILDWVPGHFCKDEHGLYRFDGTPTYEYQDFWKAENKGWGTCNFDLGRPEVKSFLISNATYWIKEFHIDGLRVDAVSNILYLNYGRSEGEWQPNIYGESGNLEAIQFIKDFNNSIKGVFPGVVTIAEESTAWPKVTESVENGGLGFTFKWNMGWMNDTLRYVELDPIYRKYHHNKMNFSMMYNYSEKFILPISHDEVVHGKKSLVNKMWGDNWCKYAGLRLYAAYMIAHPGKKLLFMGSEFGQFIEWREYEELQWHVIEEYEIHKQIHNYFKELNKFYIDNKALWELDYDTKGFEWIDADNNEQSILTFVRRGKNESDNLVFICNFTPVVYYDFKLGVLESGEYEEVFNSDNLKYGGSGQIISEQIFTSNESCNNKPFSIMVKVPPLGMTVLKRRK